MMKIIYILSFILLITSNNSCISERNPSFNFFHQLNEIKNGAKIYIIPGSGCTGCISSIEELAIRNVDNDSIYFIFTKIRSLKIFKNKFNQLYFAKNVIIDSINLFKYSNNLYEIYPVLYQKNADNIKLIQYLKP